MSKSAVEILLPTYNQARYIGQFLESLTCQTNSDWRLLVRDDVSSDATPEILEKWRPTLAKRLEILADSGSRNLKYHGNFSRLLEMSEAPYVMLADPDDIWMSDKVAASLSAIKEMEELYGSATPCLAHSDLFMVNRELRPIAPSLWTYQGLYPKRRRNLSRFLMENTVWGCTLVANRALVSLAGATPEAAYHTDWWMALVAATFGKIGVIDRPTIFYRRHGSNISETSSISDRLAEVLRPKHSLHERLLYILADNQTRATAFARRFSRVLTDQQNAKLKIFDGLLAMDPIERRFAMIDNKFFFTSNLRTLGSLIYI